MLRVTPILFLTLKLLVLYGGCGPSARVSTIDAGCEGYWDSSTNKHHCWPQITSPINPKIREPRPAPAPLPRDYELPRMSAVKNRIQEAQGSAASSPTAESGAGHPASRVGEPSSEVSDRRGGSGRGDETVQPSSSSRVSEAAASPTTEYSEQKVDPTGRELGTAGEHQSVEDRDKGKEEGEKRVAGEQVAEHESGRVVQPSPQGVGSGAGQSDKMGVVADTVDVQDSTKNATRSGNDALRNGCVMILSATVAFICS
ncbi:uncharacterized protein TEOVI_000342600 [Trypanosoma equiperdum]|uniref:Expression site-associated gene 9 (ESAG9) protein n=1 Tax=Trypanosoma equiperdum TaxID=5694 RepID=A0A1G4IHV2_TRYEQ|nr:hypothetical protein TEOVI_000342600 [Trypanosoma equiperdum]